MKADRKRESGFYWVRFEGSVIVAEYTADGIGCSPEGPHWHLPAVGECFKDREVCELLSPRLVPPFDVKSLAHMTGDEAEAAGLEAYRRATEGQ